MIKIITIMHDELNIFSAFSIHCLMINNLIGGLVGLSFMAYKLL